jgi:putative cationic outer membrane protein ompH
MAKAQENTLRFGYISYQEALKAMPEYNTSLQEIEALKGKYAEELKRVEDEFNVKYEDFLNKQKDFAPSILRKRQAELQDLIKRNVAFKEESQRLLKQAEQESNAVLRTKLNTILTQLGVEHGLAFVLNTDNDAAPYVNKLLGEDLLPFVKETLKQ